MDSDGKVFLLCFVSAVLGIVIILVSLMHYKVEIKREYIKAGYEQVQLQGSLEYIWKKPEVKK